jgi:hypothetical protein
VVIGVDVGVGCTGVALNEKEKLLEQHVGVLTTPLSSLAAFENCWAGRSIAGSTCRSCRSAWGRRQRQWGRRFAMHVVGKLLIKHIRTDVRLINCRDSSEVCDSSRSETRCCLKELIGFILSLLPLALLVSATIHGHARCCVVVELVQGGPVMSK